MKTPKLTKAQRAALERMGPGLNGVGRFNGRNRPALHALYGAGLAEFVEAHDFGFRMSVQARITDTGRAAIAAAALAAETAAREAAERKADDERRARENEYQEALAAEKRRADEADAARKAEAEAVAKEQAARDAEAKRLLDEQDARDRDRAHRGKVMGAAKDAIIELGADAETAKKIVLAIVAGEVPAVTLRF